MAHPPNIPATAQTDERNFPTWEPDAPIGRSGSRYPYQITREFMPEDRDKWVEDHKQFDEAKNKYYWNERCPRARITRTNGTVILGDPVPVRAIQEDVDEGDARAVGNYLEVRDPEQEARVCKRHGLKTRAEVKEHEKAQSFTVQLGSPQHTDALERLRKENEELEAALARNVELKAAKVAAEPPPVATSHSEKMKAAWAKRKAAKVRSLEDLAGTGEKG